MIKSILRLAVIVIIGIIAYNYFLGNEAEKEQAREIVKGTGKVIKGGVDILKDEYQKFKDGKYDKALDKIGNLLKEAKEKGGEMVEDIRQWEEKRQIWKEKKDELIKSIEEAGGEMTDDQKKEMEALEAEGKALAKEGKDINEKAEK